jgi:hypothetical protein
VVFYALYLLEYFIHFAAFSRLYLMDGLIALETLSLMAGLALSIDALLNPERGVN